ncbi:hypothetical protein D3C86_1862560 [compost metagenome]
MHDIGPPCFDQRARLPQRGDHAAGCLPHVQLEDLGAGRRVDLPARRQTQDRHRVPERQKGARQRDDLMLGAAYLEARSDQQNPHGGWRHHRAP